MSRRSKGRAPPKGKARDRDCECLDYCLESANLAPTSNVISVLNKAFVDCYLRCSECCRGIDYVSRFSERVSRRLMNVYECNSVKQLLDLTARHVNNLVEGVRQVFPTTLLFKARLLSRLAIHCSSKHLPLQISLAWDPTLNVPYIPSSSIKGVARSYFEENGITIDGVKLDELFGTTEHQGGLVFFDAYPVKCGGEHLVEADVITPHYRELDGLIDEARSSPIPLVFPVIARGVELDIVIALEESLGEKLKPNHINTLKEHMAKAFERGLGAKTSVGYGRIRVLRHSES